jgi:hypothetical protein
VPHNGAEPFDIEVRVFQLQWIERPLDQINSPLQRVLALRKL